MTPLTISSPKELEIDAEKAATQIQEKIRDIVFHVLRRKGAVIAISGGVDSSVTAALCARALGKNRVLGLLLPESESSHESASFARLLADALGIPTITENIGPVLEALGCYKRRDEAIATVIPEFGKDWKCKIVLPTVFDKTAYPLFSVVAQAPDGKIHRARLSPEAYLGVVAATNFKQRTRKMFEYYHADRLWYSVAGTPNRLEYDLGFFVKNGDGAADFKPIAHLYKTQVYQLGRYLGVPEDILRRMPTTDTYSMEQSQEEFYFSLPLEMMDLCLYNKNHGIAAEAVAASVGLPANTVERVYQMIDSKRAAARYLHFHSLLVKPLDELALDLGAKNHRGRQTRNRCSSKVSNVTQR